MAFLVFMFVLVLVLVLVLLMLVLVIVFCRFLFTLRSLFLRAVVATHER